MGFRLSQFHRYRYRIGVILALLVVLNSLIVAQDISRTVPITPDNVTELELIHQLGGELIGNIVWSPNGDIFALPKENQVEIYAMDDFTTPIDTLPMKGATVFSPDGRFLASESGKIWDFEENRLRGEFIKHGFYYPSYDRSETVIFDPTSRYLFSRDYLGVGIWNILGVGPQNPLREEVGELHISSNGQYLIGRNKISNDESEFYIWLLPDRELLHQFRVDGNFLDFAISTDSQTIIAGDQNRLIWVDIETGETTHEYFSLLNGSPSLSPNVHITLSPNENAFFLLGRIPNGLAITKLTLDASGLPLDETVIYEQLGLPNWGGDREIGTMTVSPDGRYLSLVSQIHGFALINLETKQREYYFLEHMDYIRSLQISEDNRYLAVGNGRANLHIWNLDTLEIETALWGEVENTDGVIFDGDDFYLVQMDYDGQSIGLWNIREKRLLAQLEIPPHLGETFAYNREKHFALAVTETGMATLWQVNLDELSITEIVQFDTGCQDGVSHTTFSGDGTRLLLNAQNNSCSSILDINSRSVIEHRHSDSNTIGLNYDGTIWLTNRSESACFTNLDTEENECNGPLRNFPANDVVWGITINSSDEIVAGVLRFGEGYLYVIGTDGKRIDFEGSGQGIIFSSDDRLLIAGTNDGYVNLYGVIPDE